MGFGKFARRAAKVGTAAARGGPMAAAAEVLVPEGKSDALALVLKALESERVQQVIADLVGQVLDRRDPVPQPPSEFTSPAKYVLGALRDESVVQAVNDMIPRPAEVVQDGLKHAVAIAGLESTLLAIIEESPRIRAAIVSLAGGVARDPHAPPGGAHDGRVDARVESPGGGVPAGLSGRGRIILLPFLERMVEHEGKRLDYYLDQKGIVHVGIGHNCETDTIPDEEQQVGMTITEDLCQELFDDDLEMAENRAVMVSRKMGCDFDKFPEPVQEALVEMAFQLGSTKWRGMFTWLGNGQYAEAAREALRSGIVEGKPSKWFLDTPQRCCNVVHFLSDRTLWFEPSRDTHEFADGKRGPVPVEHLW